MNSVAQIDGGSLVAFLVGLAIGGLAVLAWRLKDSARFREERARLVERLNQFEREAESAALLREEHDQLRVRAGQLEAEREANHGRLAWIHTADEQLRASFDAAASRALEKNADQLLARSERQLGRLADQVADRLGTLEEALRTIEQARTDAYSGLRQEISLLRDAHGELRDSASGLRNALASPNVRGRWGEAHLQRVVELAGMVEHVDFSTQPTMGGQRPDMVIHMPHGGGLPVDAKTPLEAYLKATEATDESTRRARIEDHTRAVRQRIAELAARSYWKQFDQAPEAVVMYVPNESALAAAFAHDPALLEHAFAQRVLPATPVTLLALLKTVAFGWQQQRIAESARAIATAGRALHDRLDSFVGHLSRTGRGLDQAVQAYNQAIGSLESRVMPAARRLQETGSFSASGAGSGPNKGSPVARAVRQPAEASGTDESNHASGDDREATRST